VISFGLLSYGLAAVGFLILALLLAISWEGRSQGVRLIVACTVTAAWAALLAVGSGYLVISAPVLLLAEFLRYGAWIFVLTGLTRATGVARGLGHVAHLVWFGCVAFLLLAPTLIRWGIRLPEPAGLLSHAGLALSLLGLVLLEQIYRAFRISRGEPYHK